MLKPISINLSLAMEEYKSTTMLYLEQEVQKYRLFEQAYQAALDDGFPSDKKHLFVWLMALLGNRSLQFGLETGSLCSMGQRFFGTSEECMRIEGLERRDIMFLNALASCIDDGSNDKLPFIITYTPEKHVQCIKAKDEFLWSQEMADQVKTRRGLLPPVKPAPITGSMSSVYGDEIPHITSRCGKIGFNGYICQKPLKDRSEEFDEKYRGGVLDYLSNTACSIVEDTLNDAMYLTKGIDPATGLPKRRIDPESGKFLETVEEWKRRQEQWKDYLASRKYLAAQYVAGRILYTRWADDCSLRMYNVNGAEINVQGPDAQKAILCRHHKTDIAKKMKMSWVELQCKGMTRFNGETYMVMAFASACGYDKKEWDIRQNFVSELLIMYHGDLQPIYDRVIAEGKLPAYDEKTKSLSQTELKEVDDPAMALTVLTAMDDSWNKGIDTGLFIQFDATASGPQIGSVEHLDVNTAYECNLIQFEDRPKQRRNVYYSVRDGVVKLAEEQGRPLPSAITSYRLIKNTGLIPYNYGSNSGPLKVFGKAHIGIFTSYMKHHHPCMSHKHGKMVEIWNKEQTEWHWKLPDAAEAVAYSMGDVDYSMTFAGATVTAHNKNIIHPKDTSRQLGANRTQSEDAFFAREVIRAAHPNLKKNAWILRNIEVCGTKETCDNARLMEVLELGKKFDFYSLHIVELVTNLEELAVVPKDVMLELLGMYSPEEYDILPIHDCFMLPPHGINHARAVYIYLMYKVARSEKWERFFMYQFTGKDEPQPVFYHDRQEFAGEILRTADYALC